LGRKVGQKGLSSFNRDFYSDFVCTECGSEITLSRVASRIREANHIKHIYCHKCRKETMHKEFRHIYFDKEKEQFK
jgi:ribosomal protein L37AE/L43A